MKNEPFTPLNFLFSPTTTNQPLQNEAQKFSNSWFNRWDVYPGWGTGIGFVRVIFALFQSLIGILLSPFLGHTLIDNGRIQLLRGFRSLFTFFSSVSDCMQRVYLAPTSSTLLPQSPNSTPLPPAPYNMLPSQTEPPNYPLLPPAPYNMLPSQTEPPNYPLLPPAPYTMPPSQTEPPHSPLLPPAPYTMPPSQTEPPHSPPLPPAPYTMPPSQTEPPNYPLLPPAPYTMPPLKGPQVGAGGNRVAFAVSTGTGITFSSSEAADYNP